MSGKVYVRKWDDTLDLYEAVAVDVAENGVVDVECVAVETGRRECAGWWKWHSEGAHDLYGYIDELASLPGWSPALRELIFSNLEARRAGRMRRYVRSVAPEASQGKVRRIGDFNPPA